MEPHQVQVEDWGKADEDHTLFSFLRKKEVVDAANFSLVEKVYD